MKQYIQYKITTLEPLKLAGEGSQQGTVVTRNFIQGSAIRGVLIGKYLKENSNVRIDASIQQREKFLTNTKFYSAYLAADDTMAIPVPYLFQADKQEMREQEEKGKEVEIQSRFDKKKEKKATQAVKRNSFCIIDGECMQTLDIKKVENLHIQKAEEKDKEAIMFRYEAIAPGQTFIGYIQCEYEWKTDFERLLKTDDICYIGGSKGSGYGKCKLSFVKSMEYPEYCKELPVEKTVIQSNQFTIYALSDLILYDGNGMVTNELDVELLKEMLGLDTLERKAIVCDMTITSGYNNKHKAHSVQQTAVRAGSIFQYEYTGTLQNERVEELEIQGVGIRRQEGYGRILVNPDFNQNKTKPYTFKKNKNLSSSNTKPALSKAESEMVQKWIDKIALQKNSDYIMFQLAQKDYEKKKNDWNLNNTKSNKLRDVLDTIYESRLYNAYNSNLKILSDYMRTIKNTSAFDATMLYVPEGGVERYSPYDKTKRPPVSLYQFLQKMAEGTATLDLIHENWKNIKIQEYSDEQRKTTENYFYECCLYLKELVRYYTREDA